MALDTPIPSLLPGAEPFFFRGNNVGCLLLHGFTASPQEMRGLGKHLAAQGYTVFGPRLTHHGTQPADMNRSRWWDWYLAGIDGWHVLQAQCDQIVIVGLSMGSSIALMLASQLPARAVVSLSTLISLRPGWRLRHARYLSRLVPYLPKPGADRDPERWIGRYLVRPLRAVAELADFLQRVEAVLPLVTAPILLVHSQTDELVSPENMEIVHGRVSSAHKEKVLLEESAHVITEGVAKEVVFGRVADFVCAHVVDAVHEDY